VATDFWIRAIPQIACSDNDSTNNIKGILHYDDSTGTPTTTAYDYTDSCADEDLSNLVPYLSKTVSSGGSSIPEDVTVGRNSENHFKWYLNSTTMLVDWEDPTLLQLNNGVTTFEDSNALIELPDAGEWVYLVIETAMAIPHPIHLHGFDFFVIAQGTGSYSSSVTLNLDNPPRRDTAMLPASGYLVMAFETDNPGAWLMHCHIGWHTSEGFALQFLVRKDEILGLVDTATLTDTCSAWSDHATVLGIEQDDSGV
jgi:hypothetical protein